MNAETPKHTPGPWRLQESHPLRHGTPLTIVGPKKRELVASVSGACLHDPRHKANATLIAAAPDMLATLKRLVYDHREIEWEDWEAARAVIAKAEGRA